MGKLWCFMALFALSLSAASVVAAVDETETVIKKSDGSVAIDGNKALVPVVMNHGDVMITKVKPGKECVKIISIVIIGDNEESVKALEDAEKELKDAIKEMKKKKAKVKKEPEQKVESPGFVETKSLKLGLINISEPYYLDKDGNKTSVKDCKFS
jgi:hypothetical protein